ncbi:hypothetical protein J2X20_002781 [Pelomonas saccharophila]|uniref:Tyr recombinase domain-containing protein n=1 Tax=Roseateles saccharophilus TaxID=304 RepID=A0ABU1YMN6_ROSSA|nr:hypothetical protein [Roseateles saccharophilus]MDR7270123.1 hypothetical protein [Roseateles saccharophilus]
MTGADQTTVLIRRHVAADGSIISTFDLSEFNVPSELADGLLSAHAAEYGHLAKETQRQAFRCIRKLLVYITEPKATVTLPLCAQLPMNFHRWLAGSGLAGSTAQSVQANVLILLRWCQRNRPGLLDQDASFMVPSFRRQEPKRRGRLEKEQVKRILAACYEEITKVERRLEQGRRLLAGDYENESERFLSQTLCDAVAFGKGSIPTQRGLAGSRGNLVRRINDAGGHRALRLLLSLGTADILPFYLAVVIQTGGNPMAIRMLFMDCISPHPLREDLECINWDKPRSGREQRVDFPQHMKWSAPNIIRKILALNRSLREKAKPRDKGFAFLAASTQGTRPEVPSLQSLHNCLADFIKQHGFPDFDFKDWRFHVAKAHRIAGGSVDAARKRLNHRTARTTAGYTGAEDMRRQFDEKVVQFQGQLIRQSAQTVPELTPSADGNRYTAARTVFGFDCSDPFGGLDGKTAPGHRCLNFTRCSTCPGALVPVDDPHVVAALLSAMDALDSAKKRAMANGWWPRYKALYEDSLEILRTSILPAVPPNILAIARTMVRPHLVPYLE